VICGNIYITEVDWAGRENLIPSPQDDLARDDAGAHTQPQASTSQHSTQLPHPQHQTPFSSPFHREVDEPTTQPASVTFALHAPVPNPTRPKSSLAAGTSSSQPSKHESIGVISAPAPLEGAVLDDTSRALYVSLKALTERLNSLASNPFADPSAIGATAEAITKVTQALASVRSVK
jgi:hypothetical protein